MCIKSARKNEELFRFVAGLLHSAKPRYGASISEVSSSSRIAANKPGRDRMPCFAGRWHAGFDARLAREKRLRSRECLLDVLRVGYKVGHAHSGWNLVDIVQVVALPDGEMNLAHPPQHEILGYVRPAPR